MTTPATPTLLSDASAPTGARPARSQPPPHPACVRPRCLQPSSSGASAAAQLLLVGSVDVGDATALDDPAHGRRNVAVASVQEARLLPTGRGDVVVAARWAPGDVLALVRSLAERPDPPAIVVLTRSTRPADAVAALRAGADDHLCWPAPVGELWARIRRLATSAGAAEHTKVLRLGPLVVDCGLRRVRLAGQVVPTTPTQFELLVALLEAQEQTVRIGELMDRAWDAHQAATSALLRPQLARLRTVLGRRFDLACVRGQGYRLAIAEEAPTTGPADRTAAA